MRFSILVPVYNGETYLRECLDSISNQTCDDYEVIIVDDGSTDASGVIADDYAATHSNAYVLHGQNQGPLLARRRGLQASQGQYVVFADSDDLLVPETLSIISEAINSCAADIIMYGFSRRRNLAPTTARVSRLDAGLYVGKQYDEIKSYAIRGYMSSMWMKAVRRSVFDLDRDYGAYAGLMHGEDLLQTLPVVDRAASLYMLDAVLYFYRPNDAGSTAYYKEGQLSDITRVNQRLLEYGRKWGDEAYTDALKGEAIQYINLLTIIALSDVPRKDKFSDCEQVRVSMERHGAFDRAAQARLRIDHKFELDALRSQHYAQVLHTIHLVQSAKHLPGLR